MRRWMWLWMLAITLAPSRAIGVDFVANERSIVYLDLFFEDANGVAELPASFQWGLNDRKTRYVLKAPTTVSDPSAAPCPRRCGGGENQDQVCTTDLECPASQCLPTPSGCSVVTLTSSETRLVGACSKKTQKPCLEDADCTLSSEGTCQKTAGGNDELVFTVVWPYGGDQATHQYTLKVRNLEFFPFP